MSLEMSLKIELHKEVLWKQNAKKKKKENLHIVERKKKYIFTEVMHILFK